MLLQINDTMLVIIGIAVMVLLFCSVLVALVNIQRKRLQYQKSILKLREAQQNQLIEAAVRTEETERHRIAEVLHDEVGAILSSSKLHLQGIKTTSLDSRDKILFDKSEELLNEGIHKVRSISHNLHSNILKEFGLNEAISHFFNKLMQGTLIEANLSLDDSYSTQNPENDISIYRMLQELLNNILKHAAPTSISIRSVQQSDQLEIAITHNGDGLTQEQFETLRYQKEGLGLKNIQNRVILLRGDIHFSKAPQGCTILLHVPTQHA